LTPQALHMEDVTSSRSEGDRLQPALLDRLTDDEPGQKTEPLQNAVVSKARLKRTVLRDLVWLLNTTSHHTGDQLTHYPEVRKSVVNFGIPVLSGKNFSGVDWRELEDQIRTAILAFEPRILPDSLRVRALTPADMLGHHNVLQFELHGELWSVPFPIELLLRSELDLETGYVKLTDQFSTGAG
jgi:type VI secretion system protein ImpF